MTCRRIPIKGKVFYKICISHTYVWMQNEIRTFIWYRVAICSIITTSQKKFFIVIITMLYTDPRRFSFDKHVNVRPESAQRTQKEICSIGLNRFPFSFSLFDLSGRFVLGSLYRLCVYIYGNISFLYVKYRALPDFGMVKIFHRIIYLWISFARHPTW